MSGFCGSLIQTALTDEDLTSIFTINTQGLLGGAKQSLLGSATISSGDRDPITGLLLSDRLKQIVENLQSKGALPTPPAMASGPNENAVVQQFMKSESETIDNIKKEYCFYMSRYMYSFNKLIEKLQAGYGSTNTENQALVKSKLATTTILNQKLNDLVQIVNEFTKMRLSQSQTYNTSINSLNDELLTKSKSLTKQNKILKSGQADAELYKEMVKYTREKTNYTNNMLMIYSFLNITALGLLFFAYQNAE